MMSPEEVDKALLECLEINNGGAIWEVLNSLNKRVMVLEALHPEPRHNEPVPVTVFGVLPETRS